MRNIVIIQIPVYLNIGEDAAISAVIGFRYPRKRRYKHKRETVTETGPFRIRRLYHLGTGL